MDCLSGGVRGGGGQLPLADQDFGGRSLEETAAHERHGEAIPEGTGPHAQYHSWLWHGHCARTSWQADTVKSTSSCKLAWSATAKREYALIADVHILTDLLVHSWDKHCADERTLDSTYAHFRHTSSPEPR